MAGLLDFLNTPAGQGLLSGVASYAMNARQGTPVNNVGRGLAGGLMGYTQANDQLRHDDEKQFQNQYRQMQIEQMQQQMEAANQAKQWRAGLPAALSATKEQAAPFQADNAFGEDLGNLQSVTQVPDMQARQEYLMAPGSPVAEKILENQLAPQLNPTSEMKNWQFAQTLPEDQRAAFIGNNNAAPATVQEWQFFSQLDPQSQAAFLEMKRNPQIMNLGGSMAVRAPGGGVGESYTVTPKITETPEYQGQQETAKATARAGVEQGAEAAKKVKTSDALLTQIDRAESILRQGNATGSMIGAGVAATKGALGVSDASTQANQQLELISGWMVSNVPRMEGPQSNFDVQNYKTMAAVVGDKTKPIQDRLAALQELRGLQEKYKTIQTGAKQPVLDRGEILNEELRQAVAAGDTQNASLIRQEMRRMGVKEASKPKQDQRGAYDEYLNAYRRAKTPEQRRAITERARQLGVVK